MDSRFSLPAAGGTGGAISCHGMVCAVILGITMIPCVLIVHELIANALQHAYPGREHGEIHLDLSAGNNGRYTLRVHGNGGGFPEGIDFRRVESLGLK